MYEIRINNKTIFAICENENDAWAKYVIAPKAEGNIKIMNVATNETWQFENWKAE